MQDGNAKQLVTERVKNATNILVTVSSNPSVDELSAALGLTLLLNKLDKHATAVFSGAIPPAITFLEPNKTFENTVDSLRDFIIALDKEKADRLRYKVEDNVVRIFITPYKTTITDKDLQFSQGDFNVELIIALNVEKREDLDAAIVAHGRILHDATIVTINARKESGSLGAVDWQDPNASSLCEMLVSISESFGSGLLDQQMANAFLTGIVASTERFSNQRTSPKVMTMAAQLMAAGANQQLIATKLEEGHAIPTVKNSDGTSTLDEGTSEKLSSTVDETSKKASDGEMQIAHELPPVQAEAVIRPAPKTTEAAEEERLAQHLDAAVPKITPIQSAIVEDTAKEMGENANLKSQSSWMGRHIDPPTLGGTLNATSEEALQEKLEAEDADQNHRILSHDNAPSQPSTLAFNAFGQDEEEKNVDGLYIATPLPPATPVEASVVEPPVEHTDATPVLTLAELEAQAHARVAAAAHPEVTISSVDQARNAVTSAFDNAPFDPARNPSTSLGAKPLPSIDHLETIEPPEQNITPVDVPNFTMPPLPDMSTLPPLPPLPPAAPDFSVQPLAVPPLIPLGPLDEATDPASTPPPAKKDPGQFKIPGQQ